MKWFGTGRPARGAPRLRCLTRPPFLVIALVVAGSLAQTGCQSGMFGACGSSPCGGTSPCGYFKSLRARVFHSRSRPSGGCCGGSTIGGEAPIDYGAPAVVTPGVPGTTVVPGSGLPVGPIGEPPATDLSPIEKAPSAAPGSPSDSNPTGARSSNGRASYEATVPRNNLGRIGGDQVNRAVAMTPQPTARSARGAGLTSTVAGDADSLLENLPPVEVPAEWARNDVPPPAPAAAPEPPARSASRAVEPAAAKVEASPSPSPPAEVNAAPGVSRFVSLEPKLAGGALPTNAGLDWLVEKGYKTILDLRESGSAQPTFDEEVTKRGLRYVKLPIGVNQLDNVRVSRFNDELSLSDSRPLYFFDADGTRPGALWYIRRMTVDKINAQDANREAEELGLTDKAFWKAATAFVERQKPNPGTAPAPAPSAGPSTSIAPPPLPPAEPAESVAAAQAAPPAPDAPPAPALPRDIAHVAPEPAGPGDRNDPTAWRSYAALMVTGLGVPLAYWSRTALPALRMLSKASLPAAARSAKSLPPASGE